MTSTTIGIRLAHRSQRVLAAVLSYLWSGWGAIASLLLFCALWEWGAQHYGELLLPGPQATMLQLLQMLRDGVALEPLQISARRALYGLGAAVLAASLLGMLAGRSMTAAMAARPLVTLLLGMPPLPGWCLPCCGLAWAMPHRFSPCSLPVSPWSLRRPCRGPVRWTTSCAMWRMYCGCLGG